MDSYLFNKYKWTGKSNALGPVEWNGPGIHTQQDTILNEKLCIKYRCATFLNLYFQAFAWRIHRRRCWVCITAVRADQFRKPAIITCYYYYYYYYYILFIYLYLLQAWSFGIAASFKFKANIQTTQPQASVGQSVLVCFFSNQARHMDAIFT